MSEILEIQVKNGNNFEVLPLDVDNEIEIRLIRDDASTWISIDQAKQVIEFLTKQIEKR
jgi:hypothetical protein